jgi:hypothetical protein
LGDEQHAELDIDFTVVSKRCWDMLPPEDVVPQPLTTWFWSSYSVPYPYSGRHTGETVLDRVRELHRVRTE